MGLREQIIGILRNSDTQRISFSFNGTGGTAITVNGTSFTRVANAIQHNQIHVRSGGVASDTAMYSAHASRTSAANTFYVGSNNRSSRDFDALMVHEAVHASFDLTSTSIQWMDNEIAAYIAQGFYLRNSGYSADRMDHSRMPYLGRMIVDAIRGGEGANGFWMDQLRGALQSDPMYSGYINTCFQGDG